MRKQAAKYRALESDKQSLLEETQTMAADLAAAQRKTAALQGQVAAAAEQIQEFHRQSELYSNRNTELLEELKMAARCVCNGLALWHRPASLHRPG